MSRPDFIRPELVEILPTYQLLEDCYAGERAVKGVSPQWIGSGAHNNGGGAVNIAYSPYLPDPSPRNEDEETRKHRYAAYLKRAVFYNVTRRTTDGLVSAIFSKYPTHTLTNLEYLETDIDGSGQSIMQQSKAAAMQCLLKGRGGLLADMPVNGGVSRAYMSTGRIRPTITNYQPESIINWRTERVGAYIMLSLVVLSESYEVEDDGYEQKMGQQLLVLRLVDGKAESEILRKDEKGDWVSKGINPLTDNTGKPLDYIPFYFYGANNNDANIDDSPMYDVAELNIAHFRDSADYQEANFIAGQPTLVVTGLTQDWVDSVLSGGIAIGSRSGVMLPVGGDAKLLQAQANSSIFESMKHKEDQMQALGAKLIQTSNQNKTATEAAQDNAEETNTLTSIANNVSDAYTKAVKACARYIGADDTDLVVTLNTQFNFAKLSPEQRKQLMAEWQGGAITWAEYRQALVENEVATIEDADDAKATIEQEQGALITDERAE